ncbi:RNB domain-containing ribonuclease [Sphingosinicella rhizophila]|uniref:RNB domain-containing ribonuclease n=1 Tax=Sphingosinicella rhizophila TaxID=3050082 RepID=A0ABU3Q9D0_9SPHN|nr:RNB domain-containing ribonuclease [Sphingosinicella sp. GR2756]MDT9600018.1 RNB domain-containing ribonuclease [Sphingosinicella sp. GR2756]
MKSIVDPQGALARGLAAIRAEFQVPASFPDQVVATAEQAAGRTPSDHADRTDRPFVTLDPATSTDLDQAFAIERAGSALLLHYAIADIGWFVEDGDPVDAEAWRRGTTLYLPDGKAGLYPPVLSEGAASLLPDGPRPAVIFTIRVAPDGIVHLDGAERAIVRSRAKLGYDAVRPDDLPADLPELAARIAAAEQARGAARVDPPEQEVAADRGGRMELMFRPRLPSEEKNAALSLAANMAVAAALRAKRTGLFRVMAEPDARAVARLRHTARAFDVAWPDGETLDCFERRLSARDPKEAALMMAIRRAGNGTAYAPFRDGERPWHAAMAATYTHATAPLRRLADRYVVRAALAVANGRTVEPLVTDAFERLPKVMARAEALAGRVERAVIDLAEAVMLHGREGQRFAAIVTDVDERGARVQLCDRPVLARIDDKGMTPGEAIDLRLVAADPEARRIAFRRDD